MKILLPISLDRWRNPISTLQRACVQYNPDLEFHSFSNPETEEDRELGETFWKLPNLKKRHPSAIFSDHFDIVHTASYSPGNYRAAVLSKLRGLGRTKFLTTLNLEYDLKYEIDRLRYSRFLRFVDKYVAVSEAVASDIRHRHPDRFLGVIPNGFDASLYDPQKYVHTILPEPIADLSSGYPLWLATVESRKNPQIFIELAKMNPQVPFVALGGLLPGDGEKYAEQFEKISNIYWLGNLPRSSALSVMSNAGVLIFPSEREGLSLAMIESIAMKIPILAQPKSSMPELVTPGLNGELLSTDRIEEWNNAMHRWMPSRADSQNQSLEKARNIAIQKYAWDVVGAMYHDIYQQVHESPSRLMYPVNPSELIPS